MAGIRVHMVGKKPIKSKKGKKKGGKSTKYSRPGQPPPSRVKDYGKWA